MSPRRLLPVLAALGAALALGGPAAAQPNPADFPETLSTAHFRVHWTGDFDREDERATIQEAGDVAAWAEQAYELAVTTWGYPAPPSDGDSLIDIWLGELAEGVLGVATKEPAGNPTSGWIALDAESGLDPATVAHEVFHVIQFGIWTPADSWFLEGSAEWVGYHFTQYAPPPGVALSATYSRPDLSLDCDGPGCGDDPYEAGGYSRWPFFQYLYERFGSSLLRDVLVQGGAAADASARGATLLANTLTGRGKTLPDVFGDYTVAHMAGAYAPTAMQGVPPAHHVSVATGTETTTLPVRAIPVNHLAARYVRLVSGGATVGNCHAATLSLTVALPAGVTSRPHFYSPAVASAPLPLNVSGSTASLSVPWTTCAGSATGYLSLPNASVTGDAKLFHVSGSLSVDRSTILAPAAPPQPFYSGPSEAAPTAELPPSIHVYGAQTLRVSASTRVVRLIVFASGAGRLRASLGATAIGTATLRGGNNDVRFRLPASAFAQLRRAASVRSGSSTLALTSLSATGEAGTTVTRRVSVLAAKKARG